MAMAWFTGGGMNWCWYMQANVNEQDDTIEIMLHDRLHNQRNAIQQAKIDPECVGSFYMKEDGDRVVQSAMITKKGITKEYKVSNPKNVFNYGRFDA